MKLYATVSSERATKGQGGNKQLKIDVFVYDKLIPRYYLIVNEDELLLLEAGYTEPIIVRSHRDIKNEYEQTIDKHKAKRQKDECMYNHDHSKGGCEYHN